MELKTASKRWLLFIAMMIGVVLFALPVFTGCGDKKGGNNEPPPPATYSITVNSAENGTVTADKTTAAADETVTLTVTPDTGYELNTLVYNDGSDHPITGSGFTMPAHAVTVTATFKATEAPPPATYNVTVSSAVNGSVTADKTTAKAGDTITLTVTPNNGYELDTLKMNGTDVTGSSFTMPAGNATVTATFKKINYTVTVSDTTNGTVTADKTTAKAGDTITLTVTPATGYEIDTLKMNGADVTGNSFTMPAGNATVTATFKKINYTVTVASGIQNGTVTPNKATANYGDTVTLTVAPATGYEIDTLKMNGADVTGNSFTMPAGNATVTATFKKTNYTVTIASGIVNGTVTSDKATANYGDTITLTVTPDSGYVLSTLTYNDGEDHDIKSTKSFTMPAKAVTVSATFSELPPSHFLVNTSSVTNGTLSVDKHSAEEGETVTVTATPATGYEIDTLKYNDGSDHDIIGNSFTMPAQAVTVTATFKKINYTVTVNTATNGTVTASKSTANYGDTITLTVTPATGYEIDTLKMNGADVTGNSFTMPAGNATVTATFKKTDYTVTIANGISNGTVSADKTTANYGDEITLTVTPATGYEIDTLKMNGADVTGNSFTMPAGNATVTATFKKINYNVTVASGIQNGTVSADKTTANYGDEITLTVTPATGYEIDTLKMNGADVTGNSFTMPAGNATVTATFKKINYNVTVASGIQNGSVTADKTMANYGDEITLTVTPATGYEIDTLKMNGADVTGNSFTMPAGNATVTATFKKINYNVTVASGIQNGSVTASKSTANYNDTITLTVTPATGYEIDTLKYNDGSDHDIIGNSFTMPAQAVTVTATFKKINYTVTVSDTTNGTVSADKTTANYGDEITLTVTPATGYKIDTLKMNGADVTGNSFTMPAGNATVTATFKKTDYTVTIANGISNGAVSADKTTANYGDEITLTVTPATGYEIDTLKYNDGSDHDITGNSFTMPAGNVTVTATFKLAEYDLSVVSATGGSISLNKTKATMGETVTLTVTPDSDYGTTALKYSYGDGDDENIVYLYDGTTFTMPAADVSVSAVFKQIVHITDQAGFDAIANDLTGYYVLDNDISFSNWRNMIGLAPLAASGSSWVYDKSGTAQTGEPFTGVFDGKGYIISDYKQGEGGSVNSIGTYYKGIFGYIGEGGIVGNVVLRNVSTMGSQKSGFIAGVNDGKIKNITIEETCTPFVRYQGTGVYATALNNGTLENIVCYKATAGCSFGNPLKESVPMERASLDSGVGAKEINCFLLPTEDLSATLGDSWFYHAAVGNVCGNDSYVYLTFPSIITIGEYMYFTYYERTPVSYLDYMHIWCGGGIGVYPTLVDEQKCLYRFWVNENIELKEGTEYAAKPRKRLISDESKTEYLNTTAPKFVRRISTWNLTQYDNKTAANIENRVNIDDGDLSTYCWFKYITKEDNPLTYIQLDLQENIEIKNILLYMGKGGNRSDYMRDVKFAYSTDGVNFTDIETPECGMYIVLALDTPVTARYIRAYTNTAPANDLIIREFAVNRVVQTLSLSDAFSVYEDTGGVFPNALDGCDDSNTWIRPNASFSGADEERYLLLTLSEETTVKTVSLKSTGDKCGEACVFYYSTDNVSFTEITTDIAEIAYNDGNYSITFNDDISARYVKVVCDAGSGGSYWLKIVDFSVNR